MFRKQIDDDCFNSVFIDKAHYVILDLTAVKYNRYNGAKVKWLKLEFVVYQIYLFFDGKTVKEIHERILHNYYA